MYLKVAGPASMMVYNDETWKEEGLKSDWWLFECDSIELKRIRTTVKEAYYMGDTYILENHNCSPHNDNPEKEGQCSYCVSLDKVITIIKASLYKDGNKKDVIFDTLAFLMNGEGRTVEKITIR